MLIYSTYLRVLEKKLFSGIKGDGWYIMDSEVD